MEHDEMLISLIDWVLFQNRRAQSGISGQSFTNFTCAICKTEFAHCNTATPYFCNPCVADLREIRQDLEGKKKSAEAGGNEK